MAPKRLSKQDKATKLTNEANQLHVGIDFEKAINSMRNKADVITAVKKSLIALGMWNDELPGAVKPEKEQDEEDDKRRKVEFDLTIEIHRNFTYWNMVPPRTVKILLHQLEPISLNVRMLKDLCKSGQREPPREELLKILEFVTGVDPSAEVGEHRRLSDILEQLSARNEMLGRRGQHLELPPHWPNHGIFGLSIEDGDVRITGMDKSVSIPQEYMLNCAPKSLYIENNFSQQRASVRSRELQLLQHSCIMMLGLGVDVKTEIVDTKKTKPNSHLAKLGAFELSMGSVTSTGMAQPVASNAEPGHEEAIDEQLASQDIKQQVERAISDSQQPDSTGGTVCPVMVKVKVEKGFDEDSFAPPLPKSEGAAFSG